MSRYARIDLDDLDSKLSSLLDSKLKPLEMENKKLSNANALLKEVNQQLVTRIDKILSVLGTTNAVDVSTTTAPSTAPPDVEEITPPHHNDLETTACQGSQTLIISDSIMRHVGSSCPKKPGDSAPVIDTFNIASHRVHKVVVPGARCDRLWSEAVKASHDHPDVQHVIVCVGANYPHLYSPKHTSREIQNMLTAIADLFPNARVACSLILPQFRRNPVISGLR